MNDTILIEHGAYFSRDGFVGDDDPKSIYRTTILDAKEQYSHTFKEILSVDPSKCHIVILKDTGTDLDILRNEAKILFNDFDIKGCAFVNAQTAILFSWAKGPRWHNGLIIDIGYQTTICAPIFKCKPIINLVDFSNTAGREIEEFIIQDLKELGLDENFIQRNRSQIVDYLMSSHYYFECYKDDFEFDAIAQRKKKIIENIEIKDDIEGLVRIKSPNPILPEDLLLTSKKLNDPSLTECIINITNNVLSEISAKELERIVFCGGGGQVLGLRSILNRQLLQSTDLQKSIENYEIGITNVPSYYSATSSWNGGSIIFSLSFADNFFTNKQVYSERKDQAIEFIDEYLTTAITEAKL